MGFHMILLYNLKYFFWHGTDSRWLLDGFEATNGWFVSQDAEPKMGDGHHIVAILD